MWLEGHWEDLLLALTAYVACGVPLGMLLYAAVGRGGRPAAADEVRAEDSQPTEPIPIDPSPNPEASAA